MRDVYINRLTKFLPNKPIDNESMEEVLGMIDGRNSKAKRLVLRNNRIKSRYYAIDENGAPTHNNAQLTKEAVTKLYDSHFGESDMELLACGTSSPDQLLPSHAAMVHGFLGNKNLEIISPSGACCAGMHAIKYGYLSIRSGQTNNAVCTGSERTSSWMRSDIFEYEVQQLKALEDNPSLAFNKDFLRWMLSDGAGAMLLESEPRGEMPLRIDWMEGYSYAHLYDACMYAGGDKEESGHLKPWSEFPSDQWGAKSLFAMKQDTKLLSQHIVEKGVETLRLGLEKHAASTEDFAFYLPHISSYYFYDALYKEMNEQGIVVPSERWFTNLDKVGNIGAASIFVMLEELVNGGMVKKGDRILLHVPESARFSYAIASVTVC